MSKTNLFFILAILIFFAVRYVYKMPKYKEGEAVAGFDALLADGAAFSLNQLKGNYVLLSFWGSWCGPCRADNPELVSLYHEFQGKKFEGNAGFEIVSVGVEKKQESWKRAIASDQMAWKYHILQEQGFDAPIPSLYKVREIPTKYLLGPNLQVIMANPGLAQIREFLADKVVSSR
ncbi:MAG: TlpA family protein disulfide reductase [Saprospiraceae bacterium]|nr:TlpA family protein disulfide reductase [Saprospiraceae bacterium]